MRSAAVLALIVAIWAVGLLAFAQRIDRLTTPDEVTPADGVVALTGSADRLTAAMKLLEDGKAKRLLISGVNRAASPADIRGVTKATLRDYDCCVDLGFQATDTVGNARETAAWARARGFHSLIVVTSDFHMPRAMLELHEALPDVALTPYPVKTSELDAGRWWRTAEGARRMTLEYCKYVVILAREGLLSLGPRPHPAAAASHPTA
jgi:uncharacterized SAM-binding protein YcdF (DUF218 family)